MVINQIVLGLSFNFLGSCVLVLVALFGKWHQVHPQNNWRKRCWWMGWRPFYKNTKTLKWHIKWNRKVIIDGFIPPKHLWNSIGLLLIATGFFLQLLNAIK